MSKILHIQASPRASESASKQVAQQFLESYSKLHPEDIVDTHDLWELQLPEMNGFTLEASYAGKNGMTLEPEQAKAWQSLVEISENFKSADKYVFSIPMWNFSVPYKMKHYIDVLVQSGLTFSFSPEEGFQGLVTGKPAVVIYARGGSFAPGSGAEQFDYQSGYLKHILGFIGFSDIREVFVEPTAAGPDAKQVAVAAACCHVADIAGQF